MVTRRPLALLALCAFLPALLSAQGARLWRPEDRVLISAFDEVGALASDGRKLFVATRGGLAIYDDGRAFWELPSTEEDGYPVLEQPTALAIDGLQRDVWLGTASGAVFRLRSVPPRWESVAFALGGAVLAIVPSMGAEEEGIWIETRAGWQRAGRISLGATPVARVPPSVQRRAASARTLDPALAAFRSSIGIDARARRWPITSFVRGERTEQYWFGTTGAFVLRFDALRGQPEWFWYGAPARGVSALLVSGDTVWLGGDGRGRRNGVVRVSSDLQSWQLFDALDGAPAGRIDQITASETHIYFAGANGVTRLARGGYGRMERVSGERAGSIAVRNEHVWIGTRSGLLHSSPAATRSLLGASINRIRLQDSLVWVAAADGLYYAQAESHPDSTRLQREAGLAAGQFVDVAHWQGRLFAITPDALFSRDSAGWHGPVRVPAMAGLGRLTALAADADFVWLGGARGLARFAPETGQWEYFLTPHDLPAGPVEIAPAGEYVWLATPSGALRLHLRRP